MRSTPPGQGYDGRFGIWTTRDLAVDEDGRYRADWFGRGNPWSSCFGERSARYARPRACSPGNPREGRCDQYARACARLLRCIQAPDAHAATACAGQPASVHDIAIATVQEAARLSQGALSG